MKTRNPYSNGKKRKAALAWLVSRGITQPRGAYPAARHVDPKAIKAAAVRRLTLVS